MGVLIYKDFVSASAFAADEMIRLIQKKPGAVICIASGDSPRHTCELFTRKVKEDNLDISNFFFVGLDEWVGLGPETEGSCHNDFNKRIFNVLGISSRQYHVFNGLANDLQKECVEMDRIIRERFGIDLMIVGIGMNGHIGFNEPGTPFDLFSHVIDLDETTLTVGQKYFKQPVRLEKGITLGLGHLMAAKKVFLLANGQRKSEVIRRAVHGEVSPAFPASIMQLHPDGFILVDEEAASLLSN